MKKIIILFACLTLVACAKTPLMPVSEGEPARIWQAMEALSAQATGAYRMQLSMRFGAEGDTRRVTGILWGNGEGAIRLDVMAGVGAVIAKIAEDGNDFLVYLPRENNVYFHEGSNRPLLKVGVPVPFDLLQLADLLTGRFAQLFGSEPQAASILKTGGVEYALTGAMAGKLELNSAGTPVKWRQQTGGWQLELIYDDEAPNLPKSLRLQNLNGKRAIILVKEREVVGQPFTAEQLKMSVPTGIPLLPLSQFKTPK